MNNNVIAPFRVKAGYADVVEFVYQPGNPQGERRKYALRSYSAFRHYHLSSGEHQQDIAQMLLINLMMFFRLTNLIEGRPEEEGLAENPFLVVLRKNICEEGPLLQELPHEVCGSLN